MKDQGDEEAGADGFGALMRATRVEGAAGLGRVLSRELMQAALGLGDEPRVGRYVIEARLGEGGMGTVFRARDPELERKVAIKILHPEVGAEAHELLAREARALARLSHPNVVTVHDVGTRDGQLWVAMELVEGQTLRAYCERKPEGGWREIVRCFVEAGHGLVAAHEAGVIHRDFKPDNVLVGASDGRVRVVDFGLAGLEARSAGAPGVRTHPRYKLAGTPLYLPPEVLRGAARGPLGDQYSFFVALREMLAADGTTRVPRALTAIVEHGAAEDPGARFSSMKEAVGELEALLDDQRADRRRRLLLDKVQAMWLEEGASEPRSELQAADGLVEPSGHVGGDTTLIVGAPGAGKTRALRDRTRALHARALEDPDAPVPVILSLTSLAQARGGLEAWLVEELALKYGLSRRRARMLLEDEALALMLDGLDEVPLDRRGAVAAAIDTLAHEHALTVVLTCREQSYLALDAKLGFERALRVVGGAGEDDEEAARGLVDRALAREPALTARDRERLVGVLRWLAATLQRKGHSDLWLERLQLDWLSGPWRKVAALVGVIAIAAIVTAGNLLGNVLAERPLFVGLLLGGVGTAVVLGFNRGLAIHTRDALRWSWRVSVRRLPLMLVLGLAVGLLFGAFFVLWVNLVLAATVALVMTLVVGLEPRDVDQKARPGQGLWRSAQTGLEVGAAAGLLTGIAVGYLAVPAMIPWVSSESEFVRMADPSASLFWSSAVFVLLTTTFIYGWTAVVLHWTVRVMLRLGEGVPLRLVPWLDRAVDRGLLRRVGGGWIFERRGVLDYLARQADRPDAAER